MSTDAHTKAQGVAQSPSPFPSTPPTLRNVNEIVRRVGEFGALLPTAILVAFAVVAVPNFMSRSNLSELLFGMAAVGFVALGMTFVVASGNFVDLSVVVQVGLAAVCTIALQDKGLVVALGVGLLLCVACGTLNGVLVATLPGNAIIITLATATVGSGVMTLLTNSAVYQGSSETFASFGGQRLGVLPIGFVLLIVGLVIAHVILSSTVTGKQVKLTGSNPKFAHVTGISVHIAACVSFVAASVGCWAAGVLLAGYSNTAYANLGRGYEFDALAAVIIGGNSLFGGRVSIARTAIGLVLVGVLSNILPLIGLPYEAQVIAKGAIVIVAVGLDALITRSNSTGRN
jgi:ribose transport system permease protein